MNYLRTLKTAVLGDNSAQKIAEIIPVSEEQFQCNPTECHNQFKDSAFTLKPADASTPLYETASPCDLHFLVSSGNTDWEHDAFEQSNTILKSVSTNAESLGVKVKCNVTNVALDMTDPDCLTLNKLDILLLPWFVWLKGITKDNIKQVFTIIKQILNDKSEDVKGRQGEILIARLATVSGVKAYKDESSSYVLICSHRTRDKRCGITAPIMKKEFDSQLRDMDLYRDSGDNRPNGVKAIFVNHVGGHKFVANTLIYNKHGEFIWYAKCTPLNVKFIINESILNYKTNTENVRACSKFDSIKW